MAAEGVAHEAVLSFSYDDEERAALIERSLRPEVGDIEGDRTTATLDRDGATVTVTIVADDLVALRAGLNTWSTLVDVAESAGGDAETTVDRPDSTGDPPHSTGDLSNSKGGPPDSTGDSAGTTDGA